MGMSSALFPGAQVRQHLRNPHAARYEEALRTEEQRWGSWQEEYSAFLPLPPSVNEAYINLSVAKRCRRVDSPKKRVWTSAATALLTQAGFAPDMARRTNKFAFSIVVGLSSWRRDIDGCIKLPLDLMCKRLGLDDRYCLVVSVKRVIVPKEEEGIHVRLNVFGE